MYCLSYLSDVQRHGEQGSCVVSVTCLMFRDMVNKRHVMSDVQRHGEQASCDVSCSEHGHQSHFGSLGQQIRTCDINSSIAE